MNEEVKILTPIKAIRSYCLGCMCGNAAEVRNCVIPDCPLYPYRMGHNPKRKGMGGNIKALTANSADSACEIEEAAEVEYSGIDYEDS